MLDSAAFRLITILLLGTFASCKDRTQASGSLKATSVAMTDPPGSLVTPSPNNYNADTLTATNAEQLKDPLTYQTEVIAKEGRVPKLPRPLANKSVLEKMRENRVAFSKGIPGNLGHEPTGAGGLKPKMEDMAGIKNMKFAGDLYSASPTDQDVKDRCIGYDIHHYSDIQLHYYCQIPSVWRACHRLLLYAYSSSLPPTSELAIKDKMGDARHWATTTCLMKSDADFDKAFVSMFNMKLADLPTTVFAGQSYVEGKKLRKYFQAMHKSQAVKNIPGVNVFDYIMESQTYAFDWRDQNLVINQFYGDMMPPAEGIWDPNNIALCGKWRPYRREDDTMANYCLPETPKSRPLGAIGR